MLEMLFPEGLSRAPKVANFERQAEVLEGLAVSYHWSDRPGPAVSMYRRACEVYAREGQDSNLARCLCGLSGAARHSGALHAAEVAARKALQIAIRESDSYRGAISAGYLGLLLATRGMMDESRTALEM